MKIYRKRVRFMAVLVVALMIGSMSYSQQQLTGVVTYAGIEELPLSDVTVGIYNLQDSLILSTNTDELGVYHFDSVPSGQYLLKSTNTAESTGVNIDDAYLILMHLLGYYEFNDIQYEIADVNNSNTVTWNDYIIVLVNYLIYGESFPAGSWKSEEHILDYTARASEEEEDTVNIWSGETSELTNIMASSGRTLDFLNSNYKEVEVNGEEFVLNIGTSSTEPINGFNLNLIFPVKKFEIISVEGPDENLNYSFDNETGELKLVWINEMNSKNNSASSGILASLLVKSKQKDVSGESFYLLEKGMILDIDGKRMEDVNIDLPYLKHSLAPDEFILSANTYPNPFIDQMKLDIQAIEDDHVTISFFDLQGRLVTYEENIAVKQGVNSIDINSQKFMPGHYFYTVEFDNPEIDRLQGRCYRSSR